MLRKEVRIKKVEADMKNITYIEHTIFKNEEQEGMNMNETERVEGKSR